jgi:DNA-binding transcriptional regulator LsrR (DeoR family)
MMIEETERSELLAQVAHLYFKEGQNQNAIAKRLNISRSSVSRLLAQALEQGIVDIQIRYPVPTADDLAAELQNHFRLREARILKTTALSRNAVLSRVGLLAAKFLEKNLRDGDVLAMSWGTTLREVVENFHPARQPDVQVAQLIGTLSAFDSEIDGANLVRRLAGILDVKYFNLSAPLIVESLETQRIFLQQPSIRQVLDLARRASIALVGIGAVGPGVEPDYHSKLLGPAMLQVLLEQNAVGDLCSRFFDIDGRLISEEVNGRVVGIDLDSLRQIPRVIGVATGEHKAKAILGALRGQFINVLITDDKTAQCILELNETSPIKAGARRDG